jgi:hypothetical protein
MRFPDGLGGGARTQAMVEPADLWATLLDWHGLSDQARSPTGRSLLPLARGESQSLRDRLGIAGLGGERAMATPAWYLRVAANAELFTWPDDLWQVNNCADRCGQVVEELRKVLAQYEQATQSLQPPYSTPLDAILCDEMD